MIQGQVVIVTGAARGIGRYIARTFAEVGAKLAAADILPLDTTLAELRGLGAETLGLEVDVRDEDRVRAMMEQVNGRFGRIDALVNNAAIPTHFGGPLGSDWQKPWPRIRDMDKNFWDRIIDTNLGGTFLCTKHVLPYMERQRSGHIINLSGGGGVADFGSCVYVVSKDAVRTFTRFVAAEEREFGVCVVALGPSGAVATEEAPAEVRARAQGVDSVGNRFVLAAQVSMELSGSSLRVRDDGQLEASSR